MANKFGAEPANVPTGASIADNVLSNFQGILSISPHGKYITGARTIIKINGKLAAFAFQVSWNIRTEQDEIWTIDDWTPYELAPKRVTVEGTIGGFYIPFKSPTKQAFMPNLLSFMFHKYITIEVKDRVTDALLFQTNKAVITSLDQNITAGELSNVKLTWKAIGWVDEKVPTYPSDVPQLGQTDTQPLPGTGGLVGAVTDLFT